MKLHELLPVRPCNCLKAMGLETVNDLYRYAKDHQFSAEAFTKSRNLGKVSLRQISEILYKVYGKQLLSTKEIAGYNSVSVIMYGNSLVVRYNGHEHHIYSNGNVKTTI